MRTPATSVLLGLVLSAPAAVLAQEPQPSQLADLAAALGPEPRPAVDCLRFDKPALLARFTPEVRHNAKLRARALALWQARFAPRATQLSQRFVSEQDWRPVLAEASALVDEFLEDSMLPRANVTEVDPADKGGEAKTIWIETIDPTTEQRRRVRRPAFRRPVLFAPTHEEVTSPKTNAPAERLKLRVPKLDPR
jgi:hypothetical protein